MPYLGENYNIDYENSTLYGHSDGGVFTHYALFNSDRYENQPFGRYIIGSPAFWGLYDTTFNLDPEGCETDYGYFDRHEVLDKKVFLCAVGSHLPAHLGHTPFTTYSVSSTVYPEGKVTSGKVTSVRHTV